MIWRGRDNHKITVERSLIAELDPLSPITEQYRTVRTNIQFASIDQELKTIMITSASPDEGKSMTAANLATVYAHQEKKVLLIDADLRKATVHTTFRLDNFRGLSKWLVGGSDLRENIQKSRIEHLDVITSGPIPPNPSELLGSRKMKELIEQVKEMYDVVIFDTPPILAVTDAQILANYLDGTILVIRSKQTEFEVAIKAKEALEHTTSKLLGTILNDCEKKQSDYYYNYYETP